MMGGKEYSWMEGRRENKNGGGWEGRKGEEIGKPRRRGREGEDGM